MAEVTLKSGIIVLVDEEDISLALAYPWRVGTKGYVVYALTNSNPPPKQTQVALHRLIAGTPPGIGTDHWNGNKLDNRRQNLRVANQHQNVGNARKTTRPTSSKYKGVTWLKANSKWQAQLHFIGSVGKLHNRYLGSFDKESDAAVAYNNAALAHFGPEFALLNKIE